MHTVDKAKLNNFTNIPFIQLRTRLRKLSQWGKISDL